MKKTFSLALVFLMLALLTLTLGSCAETDDIPQSSEGDTDAARSEEQSDDTYCTILENGSTDYIILRTESSSETVTAACSAIRTAFKNIGAEIHITTDLTAKSLKTDTTKAIVVGKVRGDGFKDYCTGMKYGDYASFIDGERIYIAGGSDEALGEACKAFCEKYLSAANGTVTLSAEDMVSCRQPVLFDVLTVNGNDLLGADIIYDGTSGAKNAATTLQTWLKENYGAVLKLSTYADSAAACHLYLGYFKDDENCLKAASEFTGHNSCWSCLCADSAYYFIGEGAATADAAVEAFIAALTSVSEKSFELCRLELSGDVSASLKAEKDGAADARIMTSNILWMDDESISTSERCEYLTDMYLSFGVDVICFNEFYGNPKTILTESLSAYYDIYYPEFEDVFNGDWTGYTNSLEKLKAHIQATPVAVSKSSGLVYADGGFRYTSEKWWIHSITWVVLQTASGRQFAVINNHYGAQEVGNFALDTLKCAEDIKAKHGDIPVVIAGDLYSKKGETAYETLIKGGYTDSCFNTKTRGSAYGWGSSHAVGTLATGASVPIDHLLFSSGDFECLKYHIIANKYTKWASDHYSVYADLKITK